MNGRLRWKIDSDQEDLLPEDTSSSSLLHCHSPTTSSEAPFTETRYLPLCRAIKHCLNKSGYALANSVEEELLRVESRIFHKVDLDSFRQYVFEAKREGVPVNFSLSVDDQIKRLYFCLTRSMIEEAEKEEGQSSVLASRPHFAYRYLPLYRAIRKCINDEGYAPGYQVEDELLRADSHIYYQLELDSLLEYIEQAKKAKAPIGFDLKIDYVEKIWFCPTDGMLCDPPSGRSRTPERTIDSTSDAIALNEQANVQLQSGFCVLDDSEPEPLMRGASATAPVTEETRRRVKRELDDAEDPGMIPKRVARRDSPSLEEGGHSTVRVKQEGDITVKQENETAVKTEGDGETEEMSEIPAGKKDVFEMTHYLMKHAQKSTLPLNAAATAFNINCSVEMLKELVDRCNGLFHQDLKLEWEESAGKVAIIKIKSIPMNEASLRWVISQD